MRHPPITQDSRETARPLPSDYIDDLRAEFPDLELSDAQAHDLLDTLFEIMATHVRMGFGLEPVGNLIASFEKSTAKTRILVNCEDAKDE